ncbi:MAG TPA: (2Fe-2S)-binding protein [Acidimicrobiales bacterium]
MIVCHCEVVSDRQIRDAAEHGACTVDEVGERCGAGTRCGSCRPTIDVLVATMLAPGRVETAA